MCSAEKSEALTIKEAATKYGVSLRTLRFYEQRGLLAPTRVGQYRLYSSGDELRLQIIIKGKKFGLSLAEIETLMLSKPDALSAATSPTRLLNTERIRAQITLLEQQRTKVDGALEDLYAAQTRL